MDRRQFVLGGMAAVAAAGAMQARATDMVEPDCDHPDHPDCPHHRPCCHHHHHAIVGSWMGDAAVSEHPIIDMMSFMAGGVMTESSRPSMRELPDGKMYLTAGHGAWKAIDEKRVEVLYRVLLQSMHTGDYYGVEEVTMKLKLHGHDDLVGSWSVQITDLTGNLITSGNGDYRATRIKI